jgi:early secretory antigenic target protein ESAT-6
MSSLIRMDYAAVANVEAQIQTAANALGQNLAELKGRLAALDWEGEDRVAYQMHMQQWEEAVVALNELLPHIRAAVIGAADSFRQNEMRGAANWGA